MTTTRERKWPTKAAAKPKRKRTPTRRATAPPLAPESLTAPREIDMGLGLTLHHTARHDQLMALPKSERRRIIRDTVAIMRRALGDMTMEEFLAERRQETERDNA